MCGSLRRGSFNRCLLEEARRRGVTHGLDIEEVGIADFPLYNQDVDLAGPPAQVLAAKKAVEAAECVLLVSPEYNYGVPGTLKNAIDWLSRPATGPTLNHRPMAVMGASGGYMGTIRAQLAWRQMWHYFHSPVFSGAEMTVSFAAKAFSDSGELTDPQLCEQLEAFLGGLAAWLDMETCNPR